MSYFVRTTVTWILVAVIGDAVVAGLIDIHGVAPNFSVIALVLLAMGAGVVPATIGGFVLGLAQDVLTPGRLGLQALCKTLLGFGLGKLRGRLVHGVPLVEAAVVAIAVFAHDFFYLLLQSSLTGGRFLGPLLTDALPAAAYSGVVAIPLLRLAEYLGILRQED